MESPVDRHFRRSLPELWPRFAVWLLITYGANYVNACIRPRVLRMLQSDALAELYLRLTSIVVITFTCIGLGWLVACYYFHLRDRRFHTAMTEVGLAIRSVIAGIIALGGFVLAIAINEGWLCHHP